MENYRAEMKAFIKLKLETFIRTKARRLNILTPSPSRSNDPEHYITAVTVVKNERRYIREWIEFHLLMGVSKFIIYDNGSDDDTDALLESYRADEIVATIPWRQFDIWADMQCTAYAHALANFGHDTRWMAFFDVDEFVFPVELESLSEVLGSREHLPVLGVMGIYFGTSGHEESPEDLVVRSYTQGLPPAKQRGCPKLLNIKCFVQPDLVDGPLSAHFFRIKGTNAVAFNELGQALLKHPRSQPDKLTCEAIRYNHYYTRSARDFERKLASGDVRGAAFVADQMYRKKLFSKIETMTASDTSIERHAGRLMDRLRAKLLFSAGGETISRYVPHARVDGADDMPKEVDG